ncbi:protein FAR1-RELATED SEQUENCE 4-like [Cucumis melo var. makuwa]|uniref:Protein FAR1-RELATED SEQUENCE 4-like n=1 Tax=Cucumis melo var. makuwa TaxID=1194695 RepID=A0A5A7US35_CUCMM|nr:protein FAR1-RELATED SEQUENCE 4-like [Cucumis melo var. makuwa]TYK29133.1 protein FAR1-RELATED SEQUENCE 4-like [Cucumis melo var. makuwa]
MVKILHGDTVESYALIPRFFDKLVESNPGTCAALEMDDSCHFKFCFMAFGPSIEGWKYCRPIISVDGTFLKCKFGGILLRASSQDGNNQIFPLAFAIVDFENVASWTWFFEKIRSSFSERANLFIVSDRHLSIPKGVLRVFPDVEYCVCTKHLLSNLKLHFKGPLLDKYFFSCAYAYTVEEFEYHMRCMKSVCSNIRDYLSSVGFEKWSRAYSHRRSKVAFTMKSHLTYWAENILRLEHEKSRRLLVDPISTTEYQVMDVNQQFIVKLNVGCCSCRVWDVEEIPCAHALAVL